MNTLMNLSPRGYDMNFIYKTCDTGGNTLLHLAAKRAKYNMISYLADKPIDERAKNNAGFSPLHIAVLDNNYELFEHIFGAFKHRFSINEPTEENETVLHIAAKQGTFFFWLFGIVKLGFIDNTCLKRLIRILHLNLGIFQPMLMAELQHRRT